MKSDILRVTNFLLMIYLVVSPMMAQQSGWQLRKEKNGIQVFTRSSTSSPMDEFKGVAEFPVSLDQLTTTLKNSEMYKEWAPGVVVSELVETKEASHYQYSENHAPFPLQNRDSYTLFKYSETDSSLRIDFEAVPDYGPVKKDKVRITLADGYWLLEKLSDHVTRVTYQVLAEPGGSIPEWLANSAAVDTPFDTLSALKEYLSGR